ncbi:hypothetical protein WR25_12525 [Diploscapter pachys]|uniref:NNMT/PNMT/TEMT family protein n=1 Tax=Diploscapter pachys TaxID=2018661 RepID=A0A2A2JV13_9BILA|nr:hypothetical protein WR25_12525 [Diploscapter pachys]
MFLYLSKEKERQRSIEDGTRVSLFALPVFAHLIVQTMRPNERQTLLDIGAGPTVYSALCFRDVVNEVYLTDYVEKNLDRVKEWLAGNTTHDWKPTIKVILRTEGGNFLQQGIIETSEEKARGVVKCGGIYFADVHQNPVVPSMEGRQVDILLTIFTLESACQTYEQYKVCVKNMMNHLRPGGRFILGSVLEDDEYNSGRSVMFTLLNLTETKILDALEEVGIDMGSVKKYVLNDEGVMFLMATKL